MKDRIELWCRIYNEGGIITKEKLYRIWRKMGKDPRSLDEFFTDKKPTLSWTPNSIVLTKHVVLTEHASEAIEAWTGKTISEYAKKFKNDINVPILEKWMKDRIEFWCRIYNEGGIITKERLYEICKEFGWSHRGIGGFAAGKKPTLLWRSDGRVLLTRYASESIKKWTGKTISEYAKKFKK